MSAHPIGTVTFLFTDVKGGTLVQQHPKRWLAIMRATW
jgi:hypothetical protein